MADEQMGHVLYAEHIKRAQKTLGQGGQPAPLDLNMLNYVERVFVGQLQLPYNTRRKYLLIQNQSFDTGAIAGPSLLVSFSQFMPGVVPITAHPYVSIPTGGYYEPYKCPNNYITFFFVDPNATGNAQNGYVIEGM